MLCRLIRRTENHETWEHLDGVRRAYIRIVFDEDDDTIYAFTSCHKGPWVSDGVRYDSFEAARKAHGLSDREITQPPIPPFVRMVEIGKIGNRAELVGDDEGLRRLASLGFEEVTIALLDDGAVVLRRMAAKP